VSLCTFAASSGKHVRVVVTTPNDEKPITQDDFKFVDFHKPVLIVNALMIGLKVQGEGNE
jgi:hypothetical protein